MNSPWRSLLEFLMLVTGAALIGVVLGVILAPNQIVAGGITGLAMILNELTGLPTGILLTTLNIPLLWLGWRYLGGRWLVLRTVVGVLVVSASVDLSTSWGWVATSDRLLVIFYGGLLSGIGLALVFRARGTTGGADILGRLMKHWFDFEIGQAMLALNILVFTAAGVIYGLEQAAVALMVSFVMTKSLDAVLHGLAATRSAVVLTRRPAEVQETIRRHLRRTVITLQEATGPDSDSRAILSLVVPRAESARLKRRVMEADEEAFLVIMAPNEIVGEIPRYQDGGQAADQDLGK